MWFLGWLLPPVGSRTEGYCIYVNKCVASKTWPNKCVLLPQSLEINSFVKKIWLQLNSSHTKSWDFPAYLFPSSRHFVQQKIVIKFKKLCFGDWPPPSLGLIVSPEVGFLHYSSGTLLTKAKMEWPKLFATMNFNRRNLLAMPIWLVGVRITDTYSIFIWPGVCQELSPLTDAGVPNCDW